MNRIVNFHVVSDVYWFEKIVVFLKNTYKMVPIDAVHSYMVGNVEKSDLCHITVDDGDISFYRNIFPVLKKHNVPATLFVSPKICGEGKNYWFQEIVDYDKTRLKRIFADFLTIPFALVNNFDVEMLLKSLTHEQIQEIICRYQVKMDVPTKAPQNMSVKNLQEVEKSGLVTIGAHTMRHPILKNESDNSSDLEIRESVTELSAMLNKRIDYFSYPNGIYNLDFSDREAASLRKANVELAFTTESKNFLSANHKYRIPRIGISDKENFLFFRTKMLLTQQWETVIKLNKNNEHRQRRKIQKLLCI